MKKFTAMLLALVMMTLPMLGLAESPAEMIGAAVAAGRPVQANVQLDFGSFPGLDEETATLVNDVVDAISFTYAEQENQTDFALQLSGNDVLTFATATEGEDTYIKSNLLGGTVAFNGEEGKVIMDRLMDLAVDAGMFTQSDVAELKAALEQATAQVNTQMTEVDLENLDLTGVLTVVAELAAKVTTAEVTEQPKNCDTAATVVTLILTGEDIAKLYNAFFDALKDVPQFMSSLDSMELTLNGQPVTAEEMMEKMPELTAQMAEMVQGDIPVQIYLDEAGEPVYAAAAATMKGEDESGNEQVIEMVMDYSRLTGEAGVTHSISVNAEDTADNGVFLLVDVMDSEKLTTVKFTACDVANAVPAPVLTVNVTTEKEYGETESEEDMVIDVTIVDSESEQEISFQLDVEAEARKVGEDVTYEADMDLHIMGLEEELLCIKVTEVTGTAAASIVAADAVRPGQMTEEEFGTYANTDVLTALQTALIGLIYNLPASVRSMMQ